MKKKPYKFVLVNDKVHKIKEKKYTVTLENGLPCMVYYNSFGQLNYSLLKSRSEAPDRIKLDNIILAVKALKWSATNDPDGIPNLKRIILTGKI